VPGDDLPPLPDADREQFALAASHFLGKARPDTEMPIVFRDPLEPVVEHPPWVFARPVPSDEPGESDAVAYLLAVTIHADEPWLIRGYFQQGASGLGLTRVAFEHFDDPTREVPPATLKDGIALGTIRDRALAKLRDAPLHLQANTIQGWAPAPGEESRVDAVAAGAKSRRRGGRAPHSPEYLRWLAREYFAVLDTPQSQWERGKFYAELAKRSRKHRELRFTPTIPTIRTQLEKAEKRGFLIGGMRGKRYTPGPNLYERTEER